MGLERFAKLHRQRLNELLGTSFAKSLSDSTFRLQLAQLDVEGFEGLLQQWMADQPGVTDTLVCDGKTLQGMIDETASGAARVIAQVSLYSNSLGVAIAQSAYVTDAGCEIASLGKLLGGVELEGMLVQADALNAHPPFTFYLKQRGADFLIAVKHSRRRGFQVIKDRRAACPLPTGAGEVARQHHGDRGSQQGHPRRQTGG